MKIEARDITLTAVLASSYVVINLVQAATVGNPAISGPVQLRIADCLISLAALFGWPAVAAVTIGGFLTNAYVFMHPVDVVVGPIANLIAASLVFWLRRRQLPACILAAFAIGIIVGGGYLWLIVPSPSIFGLELPAWMAMTVSITVSSLIATGVIGYGLLKVLKKPAIRESLESQGLKTYK